MTNQQILEKAIQKAIDGGWNKIGDLTFTRAWMPNETYVKFNTIETGNIEIGGTAFSINDVIFNHEFCKALWGEMKLPGTQRYFWQLNLQQMVIAENPIEYLRDNI